MATEKPHSTSSTRRRFGSKLFVTVCVTILSVLMLAFFVLSSGAVQGHEFCPETFSLRSVSYFQLPLVRVQVTPAVRTDQSTNSLLAHIRGQDSWSKTGDAARWDLAYAIAPGMNYQSDAKVLYEYLVTEDADGKNPWVEWSRAHPKLANVLWPEVVEAARLRRYLLIPHLMERARDAQSVEQLQASIQQLHSESTDWLAHIEPAGNSNRDTASPSDP